MSCTEDMVAAAGGHNAPDAVAVEELFWGHNITTGIGVSPRPRRDPACHRASRAIPLFEYTPMQVKQAVVGYGKAEKRQVMDMTRRLLHMDSRSPGRTTRRTLSPLRCATRGAVPSRLPQQWKRSGHVLLFERRDRGCSSSNLAVVDCGGVGYACHTTSYTHIAACMIGQTARSSIPIAISARTRLIFTAFPRREEGCGTLSCCSAVDRRRRARRRWPLLSVHHRRSASRLLS